MSDPGRDYETSVEPSRRRRDGVHYTPRAVADELVDRAFVGHGELIASGAQFVVCDPTCGAGVFLIAAADALVASGRSPHSALECLRGMDIDPNALDVARAELTDWAQRNGLHSTLPFTLVVGDALNDPWPEDGRLDVVVGNPPFGGQLAGATIRDQAAVAGAARILGRPAGYTDTSGVLLVRALDAVRIGGSVVFVQPLSVLGARDGSTVRDLVGNALESIWIPDAQLFDAAVSVCAPVLRKPQHHEAGSRAKASPPWTELAADAMGVPPLRLTGEPLSSMAECTAGFRQEFYEVAAAVVEHGSDPEIDATLPRLVTVGLIDPARLLWGTRAAKVAGATYDRPLVDISKLSKPFLLRRLPKVLVATQTRVIEAVADHDGSLWPSVPVISVLPLDSDPKIIDLLVAALFAPPASVWAARLAAGTARSPGAIRLSATQLAHLPLPNDRDRWVEGARQLQNGELDAAAVTLTGAYGLESEAEQAVLSWWIPRSVRAPKGTP